MKRFPRPLCALLATVSFAALPSMLAAQEILKISTTLSNPPVSSGGETATKAQAAPASPQSAPIQEAANGKERTRGIAQARAEKRNPRGIVRAAGEATLASRISGLIMQTPLREGESFKRGEVLVRFDCDKYHLEAKAAKAAMEIQQRNLEASEELDRFNAIGKADLGVAYAQVDKARAEHDAINSQLKDCEIRAPFAGRVIELLVRQHETVPVNQPLMRVSDSSLLEIDMIVPSSWLSWIKPKSSLVFNVDETRESLEATIHRVGASVDPVSKTVRVVARFKKPSARLLPGMSGYGVFDMEAITNE